jgi:RNA-directed DNA polymerase
VSEPKPRSFDISKRAVWEAYRRVKANRGAAGVDEQSIEEFERDLKGNLYKLWNRLSSGSYFRLSCCFRGSVWVGSGGRRPVKCWRARPWRAVLRMTGAPCLPLVCG